MAELSGDYRVVLDQPPPYNQLPVQVELAHGYVISDGLSAKVAARLKQNLGANVHVALLVFGSLPVTEGKTKRVIRNYV
jgi:phenylacetate-CoA ligase